MIDADDLNAKGQLHMLSYTTTPTRLSMVRISLGLLDKIRVVADFEGIPSLGNGAAISFMNE
jgi:hypothetical protein